MTTREITSRSHKNSVKNSLEGAKDHGQYAWHNERRFRIMPKSSSLRDAACLAGGLAALAALVGGVRAIGNDNPTTVALAFLLVILRASTLSRTRGAIVLAAGSNRR